MAGKAQTKSTKNNPNKNIIIGICAAVVVVAAIAVAIFFATRSPKIDDSYFVSDGTKYVVPMDSEFFNTDEVKNIPTKAYSVYTYSGDKITGEFIYAEFTDESTAKAALEEYKSINQDGVRGISINGKYVVIEMDSSSYEDMTASELKTYIDFMNGSIDIDIDDYEDVEETE